MHLGRASHLSHPWAALARAAWVSHLAGRATRLRERRDARDRRPCPGRPPRAGSAIARRPLHTVGDVDARSALTYHATREARSQIARSAQHTVPEDVLEMKVLLAQKLQNFSKGALRAGASHLPSKARSGHFFHRKMISRGVTRLIEHTRNGMKIIFL